MSGDVDDILLLDVTPLSLKIETLGGVATTIIEKNTTIPVDKEEIFSTATDNQPAVSIHVLQGEREMAEDNKTLARFDLTDIPPAPRGVPQIAVKFSVDANGILHVTAKDKGTGKEQTIKVESSSGLSKEEIERMQKEAELHAEEDKKKRALADTRNQADFTITHVEKSLKENEEKITSEEKTEIEEALKQLKETLSSTNQEEILQAIEKLNSSFHKISEKIYTQPKTKCAGACNTSNEEEVIDDEIVD